MSETGKDRALAWAASALSLCLACGTERERDGRAIATPVEILADYPESVGPGEPIVTAVGSGEIRSRDTLSDALGRAGVSLTEVDEIVHALQGTFDFRHAQAGHRFEVKRGADGRLSWFRYVADPTRIPIAFRGSDGRMLGLLEPVHVKNDRVLVEGAIKESLYLAMAEQGETPWLSLTLMDLFAWDIDFFTETQVGDRFRILVEKRYVEDRFVGYGRVLGAEYASIAGKSHRAFQYEFEDGKVGYYREDGKAVEKAFVKSPIKFASITSRYGLRRHPILKYVRAHKGVDYGAPSGTSVWTVGDGVVTLAGQSGGYGRVVYVRHKNGLETRYAHLRGFAQGVRSGARVSQKQVIGYVGQTGLATGPHLHFEVLRNGRHANPLTLVVPPAPPITGADLERFRQQTLEVAAAFEAPWRGGTASGVAEL